MVIKKCKICGKEFSPKVYNEKCCSLECKKINQQIFNKKRYNNPVIKKCVICGKEFEAKGNTKTCSSECSKINRINVQKEWENNHIEERREYQKEYVKNNYDKVSEIWKNYHEKHRDERNGYSRNWRNKHKDDISEYQKQYNKKIIAELNEKYDGDLNLILKDCPTTWLLREAIMQVEYNKSYSEAMYQKMKSTTVCEVTGESDDLVIHHIESFNLHPELGATQSNLVRIKRKVHEEFHSIYGYGNNTREQWIEFMGGKL